MKVETRSAPSFLEFLHFSFSTLKNRPLKGVLASGRMSYQIKLRNGKQIIVAYSDRCIDAWCKGKEASEPTSYCGAGQSQEMDVCAGGRRHIKAGR